jgi:predicted nuclease with TOPRIM domain
MIFNSLNINVDSVEFEYVTKGNLEVITVGRPDGVSYSQWEEVWSRLDGSVLDDLQNEVDELEKRVKSNSDTDYQNGYDDGVAETERALEKEISSLESENERLKDELSELKFRMEGLEK